MSEGVRMPAVQIQFVIFSSTCCRTCCR